jgi:hypothetical protein
MGDPDAERIATSFREVIEQGIAADQIRKIQAKIDANKAQTEDEKKVKKDK